MQNEQEAAQRKPAVVDLFRTPNLRKRICLLSVERLTVSLSRFGLSLNIQYLGSNVFLLQVLFGVIAIPGIFVAFLTLNHLGRRVNEMLFSVLLGISILATLFVPQEMQTVRTVVAALIIGFSSAVLTCSTTFTSELIPTAIRAMASGLFGIMSNIGGAVAPLLIMLEVYFPPAPWIIYGCAPFLNGLVILFLPETRNQPLPDTIQDVENERKSSRKSKQKSISIEVTKL